MNLIKERAKKPLIENGTGYASVSYRDGQWQYIIKCNGHDVSCTLQLSRLEMLQAVTSWMASFQREEQEAHKKHGNFE